MHAYLKWAEKHFDSQLIKKTLIEDIQGIGCQHQLLSNTLIVITKNLREED